MGQLGLEFLGVPVVQLGLGHQGNQSCQVYLVVQLGLQVQRAQLGQFRLENQVHLVYLEVQRVLGHRRNQGLLEIH